VSSYPILPIREFCWLTLAGFAGWAPGAPSARAADAPPSDRETITVIAPHLRPPTEWEKMQFHSQAYHQLKERFDPGPRPVSTATQMIDDLATMAPTGQQEPEVFRATRDHLDQTQ
jgi:hypothetical protein